MKNWKWVRRVILVCQSAPYSNPIILLPHLMLSNACFFLSKMNSPKTEWPHCFIYTILSSLWLLRSAKDMRNTFCLYLFLALHCDIQLCNHHHHHAPVKKKKNQWLVHVLFVATRMALFLRVEPGGGRERGGGRLGSREEQRGETVRCWLAW